MVPLESLALDRDILVGPDPTWEMLSDERRKDWLAQIVNFPPPPMFLEMLDADLPLQSYDPQALAKKLSHDAVLTGRLLARANSATFSLNEPITSLRQAMVHLGFNLVRSTLIKYQIETSAMRLDGIVKEQLLKIQKSTDQGAVIAFNWARKCNLPDPSGIATLCLLSRLGTFLLSREFPHYMDAFFAAGHEPHRLNFEAAKFKLTTRTLTYKVAQHWKLPVPMQLDLFNLWNPLFADVDSKRDCVACASLSLAFDPPRHMDDIDKWISLRVHKRLKENLFKCGALNCLPQVMESDSYHKEMAVVS